MNDNAAHSDAPEFQPDARLTLGELSESAGAQRALLNTPRYVYAIGRVEPQFPSLSLEREFHQVLAGYETGGMTDQQSLQMILTQRENRYLARRICWMLSIEHLPTYILTPGEPSDLDLLLEAIREAPKSDDMDVVIGMLHSLAPPSMCAGISLPIVTVDHLYSFRREELLESLPQVGSSEEQTDHSASAGELFDRIVQMADNAGATDEHRALNYLSVRCPQIYSTGFAAVQSQKSLTAVEVRPSRLSSARTVVDVIFSYTHRHTDVTDKVFIRVDVTEEFPFLVSKLQPFYER